MNPSPFLQHALAHAKNLWTFRLQHCTFIPRGPERSLVLMQCTPVPHDTKPRNSTSSRSKMLWCIAFRLDSVQLMHRPITQLTSPATSHIWRFPAVSHCIFVHIHSHAGMLVYVSNQRPLGWTVYLLMSFPPIALHMNVKVVILEFQVCSIAWWTRSAQR